VERKPTQDNTGRRGYFGKRESVRESSQNRKVESLSDVMRRPWRQLMQSPATKSPAVFFGGALLTGQG
jgi:hypothetical protein